MDRNQQKRQQGDHPNEENKDLPGYPHYPPEDDIMNPQHGFRKIAADEELANSNRLSGRAMGNRTENDEPLEPQDEEDEIKMVRGTEADVTKEDLELLGDKDEDQDLGDDELTRSSRVDELEEEQDLDIPDAGTNDDEALGREDEENNYYSLGGDRHENLEEDSSELNE